MDFKKIREAVELEERREKEKIKKANQAKIEKSKAGEKSNESASTRERD
jgi:hypothetical protein